MGGSSTWIGLIGIFESDTSSSVQSFQSFHVFSQLSFVLHEFVDGG